MQTMARGQKAEIAHVLFQGCDGAAEPTVYLHRLIMGAPEEMMVSHKDGDGLNNARSNLVW